MVVRRVSLYSVNEHRHIGLFAPPGVHLTTHRALQCGVDQIGVGPALRRDGFERAVHRLADELAERLLVVLDFWQALDRQVRSGDDAAATVDAEADDDVAAEGQAAATFDTALVRRAEDVAVEIELAGTHFGGELRDL